MASLEHMLTIRTATESDLAPAELVSQRAFAELRQFYRPKQAHSIAGPLSERLVADIDGTVAGTVQYEFRSDRLHLRNSPSIAVGAAPG